MRESGIVFPGQEAINGQELTSRGGTQGGQGGQDGSQRQDGRHGSNSFVQ